MVKVQKGFTLIELMIVIAIIGILAAVAVPQYGQYTKRAKYAEVVSMTSPVKTGVDVCLQTTQDVDSCDDWAEIGVVKASVTGATNVDDAVLSSDGQVVSLLMTGAATALNGATYQIDGTYSNTANTMIWAVNDDDTVSTCKAAATKYC